MINLQDGIFKIVQNIMCKNSLPTTILKYLEWFLKKKLVAYLNEYIYMYDIERYILVFW